MCTTSSLIIKLLCITSLLFATSSANFFWPGFHHGSRNPLRNENGEDDERQKGGIPGFGGPGFFPGPGFGRPKMGFSFPKPKNDFFKDDILKKNNNNLPKEEDENKKNPLKGGEEKNNQNEKTNKQGKEIGKIAETKYKGKWEVVSLNSGVSSMHIQLLPTNRLAMFDATSLGKSSIELPPNRCRLIPNTTKVFDCFAHAVEYDPLTNNVRTLKVETNPWCSSGGLTSEGKLVNTGGWEEGERSIRHYESCDTCDWKELNIKLADTRWYATQSMLPDGRFVLLGGRRAFTYEFLTPTGNPIPGRIDLPFLFETTDIHENNLYPFVHLAPDGNIFILANFKAILLDVRTNKIVKTYPDLPGGARNYPGSASSAILPINLNTEGADVDIEVLVCGGGQPLAFGKAEKEDIFLPALDTCGRIKVLNPGPNWELEKMPAPRVMSDMLNLPNGQILILNGAKKGASGWQFAEDPSLNPYLYTYYKPNGKRFKVLAPTQIPRMYHSSSAVLPDGRILVAGSNTNPGYQFQNVKFPTELRVEKFSPPYLDPTIQKYSPQKLNLLNKELGYGQIIIISCKIGGAPPGEVVQEIDVTVTMYKPPFTTHGYSMDQRLLNLKIVSFVAPPGIGSYQLQVEAPARPELAPPGYYLVFVNYHGVPSNVGSWVHLSSIHPLTVELQD